MNDNLTTLQQSISYFEQSNAKYNELLASIIDNNGASFWDTICSPSSEDSHFSVTSPQYGLITIEPDGNYVVVRRYYSMSDDGYINDTLYYEDRLSTQLPEDYYEAGVEFDAADLYFENCGLSMYDIMQEITASTQYNAILGEISSAFMSRPNLDINYINNIITNNATAMPAANVKQLRSSLLGMAPDGKMNQSAFTGQLIALFRSTCAGFGKQRGEHEVSMKLNTPTSLAIEDFIKGVIWKVVQSIGTILIMVPNAIVRLIGAVTLGTGMLIEKLVSGKMINEDYTINWDAGNLCLDVPIGAYTSSNFATGAPYACLINNIDGQKFPTGQGSVAMCIQSSLPFVNFFSWTNSIYNSANDTYIPTSVNSQPYLKVNWNPLMLVEWMINRANNNDVQTWWSTPAQADALNLYKAMLDEADFTLDRSIPEIACNSDNELYGLIICQLAAYIVCCAPMAVDFDTRNIGTAWVNRNPDALAENVRCLKGVVGFIGALKKNWILAAAIYLVDAMAQFIRQNPTYHPWSYFWDTILTQDFGSVVNEKYLSNFLALWWRWQKPNRDDSTPYQEYADTLNLAWPSGFNSYDSRIEYDCYSYPCFLRWWNAGSTPGDAYHETVLNPVASGGIPEEFFITAPALNAHKINKIIQAVSITAIVVIVSIIAAKIAFKIVGRSRNALAQQRTLSDARKAYLADPTKANWRAFKKMRFKYNMLARFCGWSTYDATNDWFNEPSTGGTVIPATDATSGSNVLDSVIAKADEMHVLPPELQRFSSYEQSITKQEATITDVLKTIAG